MVKLFEITDEIRQICSDAIDDLIDQLGRQFILTYPPKSTPCGCSIDPNGNKGPNRNLIGNPTYILNNKCSLCGGSGFKQTTVTSTITMLRYTDPKEWAKIGIPEVRVPSGGCVVKGYQTDKDKLRQCVYVEIEQLKYVLDGEPIDRNNIVQGRYFVAVLKRYA